MKAKVPWLELVCLTAVTLVSGFANGALGPMISDIAGAFGGLSNGVVGLVFTAIYLGALAADAASMRLAAIVVPPSEQPGVIGALFRAAGLKGKSVSQQLMTAALVLVLVSLVLMYVCPVSVGGYTGPAYIIFLVFSFMLGFGIDMVTVFCNAIIGVWPEEVLSTSLSFLHFGFGFGAVCGPWLYHGVLALPGNSAPDHPLWQVSFALMAVWGLISVFIALGLDLSATSKHAALDAEDSFEVIHMTEVSSGTAPASGADSTDHAADSNTDNAPLLPEDEDHVEIATTVLPSHTTAVAVASAEGDTAERHGDHGDSDGDGDGDHEGDAGGERGAADGMEDVDDDGQQQLIEPAGPAKSARVSLSSRRESVMFSPVAHRSQFSNLLHEAAFWLLALAILFYNGAELVCGGWIFTLAESLNYSTSLCNVASSLFWAGLLSGRLASCFASTYLAKSTDGMLRMLTWSSVLSIAFGVGLTVVSAPGPLLAFSYLAGASFASIYPLIIAVGSMTFIDPATQTATMAIGGLVLCGSIGPLVFPAFVGMLSDVTGSIRLSLVVAPACIALVLLLIMAFSRLTSHRQQRRLSVALAAASV